MSGGVEAGLVWSGEENLSGRIVRFSEARVLGFGSVTVTGVEVSSLMIISAEAIVTYAVWVAEVTVTCAV